MIVGEPNVELLTVTQKWTECDGPDLSDLGLLWYILPGMLHNAIDKGDVRAPSMSENPDVCNQCQCT